MPLPPGVSAASYEVAFEPINPLYIQGSSVGPYVNGSPTLSGSLPPMSVAALSAGMSQTLTVNVEDSATSGFDDAISSEEVPRALPPDGMGGRKSYV